MAYLLPQKKNPTRAHGYVTYIIPLTVPRISINDEQVEQGTQTAKFTHI